MGGGYTPSIKRQSVRPSVKPGDFAMYKRQIMCQEVSAKCQDVAWMLVPCWKQRGWEDSGCLIF